ncbi:MAG: hypothetical protein HRT44_02780 [Bdellovibrionales bacterium]|nr:hypothetical protein [Bdellovibrionales bacterium]NQZ18172.1 hypothetical protein [Bdellovibrionales bacterium]
MFSRIVKLFVIIVSTVLLTAVALADGIASVSVNLDAAVIVSRQGTSVSQSGGVRCSHGGGSTKRRTINQTFYQEFKVYRTYTGENFSEEFSSRLNVEKHQREYSQIFNQIGQRPADNVIIVPPYGIGQVVPDDQLTDEQKQQIADSQAIWDANFAEAIKNHNHPTHGFRSATVSGSILASEQGGIDISLKMDDRFVADIPDTSSSRCWRRENTWYRHDSNSLDGEIKIQYTLPDNSQFIKLTVNSATGVLGQTYLEKVDGSVIPGVRLSGDQYIWAIGHGNENKNVTFIFKYSAHPHSVDGSEVELNSLFSVNIAPLVSQHPEMNYAERVSLVTQYLAEGGQTEEILIPELAPLIEEGNNLNNILRSYSLTQIRQIQDIFLSYSLTSNQDGDVAKSPFVRAMVAVLATKISENLSKKLLPVCVIEETVLPVLQKRVVAQRYIFMMFYLQRVLNRLENYSPLETFSVVDVMNRQANNGLTYSGVGQDTSEIKLLTTAYDIFLNVAQIQQQPFRTASGELAQLSQFAGAFISTAVEYKPLFGLIQEAAQVERAIYIELQRQKRLYMRNPDNSTVEVSQLVSDVGRLSTMVTQAKDQLNLMIRNHLFSEVDVSSFTETMFRVFEGLNLVSGDHIEDIAVKDYYSPIFNHFFDAEELIQLSNQAQLCLSGQLRD